MNAAEESRDGAVPSASAANDDTAGPSQSEEPQFSDTVALTKDMFKKTGVFLKGELEATCEEYRLLETMNKTVSQRYVDMQQVTQNISKSLQDLDKKCDNLKPYLEQIDEIDKSSRRLEEAAYALDAYVKSLGKMNQQTTPALKIDSD